MVNLFDSVPVYVNGDACTLCLGARSPGEGRFIAVAAAAPFWLGSCYSLSSHNSRFHNTTNHHHRQDYKVSPRGLRGPQLR